MDSTLSAGCLSWPTRQTRRVRPPGSPLPHFQYARINRKRNHIKTYVCRPPDVLSARLSRRTAAIRASFESPASLETPRRRSARSVKVGDKESGKAAKQAQVRSTRRSLRRRTSRQPASEASVSSSASIQLSSPQPSCWRRRCESR